VHLLPGVVVEDLLGALAGERQECARVGNVETWVENGDGLPQEFTILR